MFSADTYSSRRQKLTDNLNDGVVLLFGNSNVGINYTDNYYHFRQDSSFLYYAGIDQINLAMIIDCETNETMLYGDEATMDDIVWTGPVSSLKSLASKSGIDKVLPFDALPKDLNAINSMKRRIHYLPPYRHLNRIRLYEWIMIPTDKTKDYASQDLIDAIVRQREVKSQEELDEMKIAVDISGEMHVEVMKQAKPNMKELDLVGVIHNVAAKYDTHMAYGIILTVNGQTLHNHHHHNLLTEGKLVLGDYGAESPLHYAGDITRTFPVSKIFTSKQKDIYQLVLEAEEYAISILRPGITYQEVHLEACKKMAFGLKDLGLMNGDIDQAVKEGAHALFMPHGLGHMIGLDVHDMEDFGEDNVGYSGSVKRSSLFGTAYLRLGKELKEGFCLTVEPGLYFIPELIDKWKNEKKFSQYLNYDKIEAYRNFGGIRIEDDVLITDNGHSIIGDPIPKSIDEIEALRN